MMAGGWWKKHLQDPLADKILAGEIADGATVTVEEGDGALVIATKDTSVLSGAST